jgi:hypothetical protein
MIPDEDLDRISPDPRRVYFNGKESKKPGIPKPAVKATEVEKIVEVEKTVEVIKVVEVEKPVVVEKIVEVTKIVEVEKPVIVEKTVVKEVPFKTVITTIEPSLKAEEELLKVYAEIATLSKRLDDIYAQKNINQRFMKIFILLIVASQVLHFFI